MYKRKDIILRLVVSAYIATPIKLFAEEVSFHTGKIDYWEKKEEAPKSVIEKPSDIPEVRPEAKSQQPPFDWNKTLDPKNDEFFKEGDYTPPAPFMEVARNPNDENIRLWHAYIEKKNLLAARLDARLREYEAKNQNPGAQIPERAPNAVQAPKTQETARDPSRYQFRLYFDSECPHCQRMMLTMKELAQKGYAVEAKQIDDKPFSGPGLPFAFTKASKAEIKQHGISSVPFLLVGDLKKKSVYKMSGFKTVSSIFEEVDKAN